MSEREQEQERNHLRRGNLLWESSRMMLPEHREQLLAKRHREEWQERNRRPNLDEQELERINRRLAEAVRMGGVVALTWWDDKQGICRMSGVVKDVNFAAGTCRVWGGGDGERDRGRMVIHLGDVLSVEVDKQEM